MVKCFSVRIEELSGCHDITFSHTQVDIALYSSILVLNWNFHSILPDLIGSYFSLPDQPI